MTARTRAQWTQIACKRVSDGPEEVITVEVMEEGAGVARGTRLRINRPRFGAVSAIVRVDGRTVCIDLDHLEEKEMNEIKLDRMESLGRGVTRLHAPGFGFADVAAVYAAGSGWTVEVQRTNIEDPRDQQGLVALFRQAEGMA
jgi:hypothetical protein